MTDPHAILTKYLPHHTGHGRGDAVFVPTQRHELAATIRALYAANLPLVTIFATDERESSNVFRIHYVFRLLSERAYIVVALDVEGDAFPSLAVEFPAFALYEREIMSMFGLKPEGHPDPRTLIMHEENWPKDLYPLRKDFKWDTRVPETHGGDYRFQEIGGEGIYEIPVGPVHAGIIEPGHFRFSVAGEEIVTLEARLGWVHKGVEKLFEQLPLEKKIMLSERISGDNSFSHSLAFCGALEKLTDSPAPERAQYLRLILSELERVIMHIFDIGNIGGNGTGFTFMAAQGFRIVEELRRYSEKLTGSRFLRGMNVVGGLSKDISDAELREFADFMRHVQKDFAEIIRVADSSATLANRLSGTGTLPPEVARDYGALGIAAKACAIARDCRLEQPYGAYMNLPPEIALESAGDVEARFRVRIKEILDSIRLIEEAISSIPTGATRAPAKPLPKDDVAIACVESCRGEIAYVVKTSDGAISRVKVRDPSFINWQLFGHMVSRDMVPDFPLINKSLNLSYTGNDL